MNLSQNYLMEMNREYVSDVDTDTDYELDYKAKKCALRTWKCRSVSADVPPADVPPADVTPGLALNPTSDMTRSNNDENPEKCEHEHESKRTLSVDLCLPPAWVGEQ